MSIRTCGRKVQGKGIVGHTVIVTPRVNHLGCNLTQAPRGRVEKYKLQMKMAAGPGCWIGQQKLSRRSPSELPWHPRCDVSRLFPESTPLKKSGTKEQINVSRRVRFGK